MTDLEFNICVDDYSDGVYRFILKISKNKEDAKDIVQTAFGLIGFKHLPTFKNTLFV